MFRDETWIFREVYWVLFSFRPIWYIGSNLHALVFLFFLSVRLSQWDELLTIVSCSLHVLQSFHHGHLNNQPFRTPDARLTWCSIKYNVACMEFDLLALGLDVKAIIWVWMWRTLQEMRVILPPSLTSEPWSFDLWR